MNTTAMGVLTGIAAIVAAAPAAWGQAQSTCSFDPATATVTVTAKGTAADLRAIVSTGAIRFDGVQCGTATVTNTDTIRIVGTDHSNVAMLTGTFAPGLTPEADGASEIEIEIDMGADADRLEVYLGGGNNTLLMTSTGIDVGEDGDEDIHSATVERIIIDGRGGRDVIDASDYVSTPTGGRLDIFGGAGDDRLTGSFKGNNLYGQEGNDTLYGGDGIDELYGGPGNDTMFGGPGNDKFYAEATLDGNDVLRGGPGEDRAYYQLRTSPLNITVGNGLADDGEAGEADEVDTEDATAGSGDDVLVGSNRANSLDGREGDDEIHGGPGNDSVFGGGGNNILFGDGGADLVSGSDGNDVLTGGAGADTISGSEGDDLIFNADAYADTVLCGDGTMDDAEPDPLDTFNACEL